MNCLEWLPIYFGILKTGSIAVPLNFRYTAEEIKYCLGHSESCTLVFGPEFIDRMEGIFDQIPRVKMLFYVGENCPTFAESYDRLVPYFTAETPQISPAGFRPRRRDLLLLRHHGLSEVRFCIARQPAFSCVTEQKHHGQTRERRIFVYPPLYHTGAKMHWFGACSRKSRVLLRGVKPDMILETVSKERCTIVWLLVPWVRIF